MIKAWACKENCGTEATRLRYHARQLEIQAAQNFERGTQSRKAIINLSQNVRYSGTEHHQDKLQLGFDLGEDIPSDMATESSHQDDETVDDNLTNNLLRGDQTSLKEYGHLSPGACKCRSPTYTLQLTQIRLCRSARSACVLCCRKSNIIKFLLVKLR